MSNQEQELINKAIDRTEDILDVLIVGTMIVVGGLSIDLIWSVSLYS